MEHLSPRIVFWLGPIPVTNTVTMTWLVIAVLTIFALIVSRSLQLRPRGVQLIAEMVVGFLAGSIEEGAGPRSKRYLTWIGSFFLFILISDWLAVIPRLRPATGDLSTTVALAVMAIISVWIVGIRESGPAAFAHHFLEPSPIMLPINIMEQLTRPLSLSIRLFGNIWGEEVLATVVLMIVPFLAPVPIMALDLFTGFMQAYIFTMLLISYIAGVLPHEDKGGH
ncbi:MAG: F0F1 ATP synthase subunit A [Bacillota bacterium]